MTRAATDEVRFTVPIYTSAEAARYLAVKPETFASWVKGYRREFPDRPPVAGEPLITGFAPDVRGGPSIPFIGLAEGMFLSALRRAGMPLQQIRPALDLVRSRLGVDHALGSRRLFVAGAQLLWEVSTTEGVDADARHRARDLIVLRDGQYVFRKVVEQYLELISYDEEYARRVKLPRYEVASIVTDPQINFGKPYFAHTGTPLHAVHDLLRAGETVADVAGDFNLPVDQVTEAAQVEGVARGVTELPPLRLFLDRSVQGRRFVAAVRALVDDVETIDDRYGIDVAQGVADLRWIADATADGRILLGADQLRGPLEKQTVRATGARYVVFGRNNMSVSSMVVAFEARLPEIQTLTATPGPWIRRISQHDFAELPLDRPPK